jgi:hypothetical protein
VAGVCVPTVMRPRPLGLRVMCQASDLRKRPVPSLPRGSGGMVSPLSWRAAASVSAQAVKRRGRWRLRAPRVLLRRTGGRLLAGGSLVLVAADQVPADRAPGPGSGSGQHPVRRPRTAQGAYPSDTRRPRKLLFPGAASGQLPHDRPDLVITYGRALPARAGPRRTAAPARLGGRPRRDGAS